MPGSLTGVGDQVLSDEFLHVVGTQPDFLEMLSAHVDLSEDVFVAQVLAVGIHVVHHAVDLKVGDHFINIIRHDEGMGLTWWLKNI